MEYGESTGAFYNYRNEIKNAVDQLQIQQNTKILYDWELVIDDSVLTHQIFKFNPPIPALKDGKIEIKTQPLEYLTQTEDKKGYASKSVAIFTPQDLVIDSISLPSDIKYMYTLAPTI